ncbi:unnamed protein product [Pleuronectes platessa]|uniref:Uncharacterized protein n=1 Tax=Pleuronectes platessa TaxID=8262 RepID=A0A9N7U573_PLEPL|nr:unnamed protein product [Pleuronectes platessa]
MEDSSGGGVEAEYMQENSTEQWLTMRGTNRSLCGKWQNRVEAVVRSGRGDETKWDERDDLHCGVFSRSAMKDTAVRTRQGRCQPRNNHTRAPRPRRPSKHITGALSPPPLQL